MFGSHAHSIVCPVFSLILMIKSNDSCEPCRTFNLKKEENSFKYKHNAKLQRTDGKIYWDIQTPGLYLTT